MKKSFLLLFVLLNTHLLFSQQPLPSPVLKTAAADIRKDDSFIGMITMPDSSVILISTSDDQEYSCQLYDKDLNFQKSTLSFLPGYTSAKNFNSLIHLGNKYFLCFSRMDRNDYWYTYYAVEFDPVSMKFMGNVKNIITKEAMARGSVNAVPNMHFGYRNYTNTVNCFYKDIAVKTTSPDSSKFLIAYSRPDSASYAGNKLYRYKELEVVSDTERVEFNVFDGNMKKIWTRDITFRNNVKPEDYAISNEGKLYVLAKLDSLAQIKSGRTFDIYEFKDSIAQPDTLFPTLAGKGMNDGKFFSPDSRELWITGTISNGYYPKAIYTTSIFGRSAQPDESRSDMIPLNASASRLYIRQILKTGDGRSKVIFEEYAQKTWKNGKPYKERSAHALINEEFGDLYVLSINDHGTTEWLTRIPKFQADIKPAASVYTYLPFKTAVGSDNIRIFYIDNKKNFEPDPSTWKTDYELGRFARMAGVYVSSSGNIRKYEIDKIDDLGSLKSEFYFSGAYMYCANHQNHKNTLYKLKLE